MNYDLFYGKPSDNDYESIIDMFSGSKINSVRTSSLPLLAFWKNTEERLGELLKFLKIISKQNLLCFEYPTSSGGKGKSSMTDLMILSNNNKIAIEAKFTEVNEKHKTIVDWLITGNKENKKDVLSRWINIIAPFSKGISNEHLNSIPYQFLHRTASACKDNSNKAYVVYQIFYDEHTKNNLENFKCLLSKSVQAVNPCEDLCFYIWEIEVIQKVKEEEISIVFQKIKQAEIYGFKKGKLSLISNFT